MSEQSMEIVGLDHLVLTVADLERSAAFYSNVLGCRVITSPEGRVALHFGSQKINLHRAGAEFSPHALVPTIGSADLCFLVDSSIDDVVALLERKGIELVESPVRRQGAVGAMTSVYIRDPDGNLVELAHPDRSL